MSQATHPQISQFRHIRSRRAAALGASSLALCAVVLTFAFGDARQRASVSSGLPAQPSLRSDGGPEEAGIAAAVGARPVAAPDESRIAAAITAR